VQFSKIISHDLQEPIHKIKVFISMVEMYDTENLSDKGKSALQKINRAADRLKQLTTGLEQFVKVDTEKKFTSVDLNKSLTSALSNVMADRQFTDFEIIGAPLPVIEGYEAQLGLLFYHLIDNSIQFRQPSERLVIKIDSTLVEENVYRNTPEKYRYLEHIRIHFSDNGIGFDNQYQDYVFDLVKKIDPLSRGLGIGLSLIKKIVSNHSGSVEVHSELGKGTRFTILLPTKIEDTLS
jgi:phosphoserine phosphatase RsbU/P